jgi:general secretion pathway protein A
MICLSTHEGRKGQINPSLPALLGLSAIFASALNQQLPREASVYESFYGLAQSPFTLAPDPRFLYLSDSHDTAIQQILQAIRRRETFIVLSGDIGTGKTTICRAVIQQLDKATLSSLVLNPFLAIEELLRQVLVDFGVVSRDALLSERFARATTHELTTTLCDFLLTLAPLRGSAVLLIDEAQHLSPRVLEELRVVASLAGDESRLLQIVLVGQPDLLDVLAAANLRQLDQRISLKALLKPLERDDVEQYIAHRLTVAGESVSVVFEPAAVKRVHELSAGVPRIINLLCDRALMAGVERGMHEIPPELIDVAADMVSFRRRPAARPVRTSRRIPRAAVAAVAGGGVLMTMAIAAPLHRLVDAPLPAIPGVPFRPMPELPIPPLTDDALRPPALATGETPDDFVAPPRRLTPATP